MNPAELVPFADCEPFPDCRGEETADAVRHGPEHSHQWDRHHAWPKHLSGTCSKEGPRSPHQVSAMPEGFGGMCLVSLTTENESSPNKQPRGPTAHICADTQKITVRSRLFFLPSTYQCLYWREQTLMFPAINPFSPLPKRVSSTVLTAPTPPFMHQTRSRGESRWHLQGRSKGDVRLPFP